MNTTAAVVIGAGPAGLAMSRCLTEHNIEHVVLERSAVANSWRSERWDSLRLLTPNWMTRLPGYGYHGADPDGYMTAAEVVELLDEYATQTAAAVLTGSPVERVTTAHDGSFVVATGNGSWRCRAVVVATGACSTPKVPSIAGDLPGHLRQLSPIQYRRPDDAPGQHVLVVGASASGLQLAEELTIAGRQVTLAVGAHTRLPRTYRGADIHHWMDATGVLDTRYDEVDDIDKARRMPSLQLIGSPERRTLDLNALTSRRRRARRPTGRNIGRTGAVLGITLQPLRRRRPQDEPAARPDRRTRQHPGNPIRPATSADHCPRAAHRHPALPILDRDLGDRIPAQLPVPRPRPAGPARRDRPRRWRDDPTGHVRTRSAIPPATEVELP